MPNRGSPLHPFVLGSGAAFARRPTWAQDVGRLAVDAVGRINDQLAFSALVDRGGAHVLIELGDFRGDVRAQAQMGGNVVARVVAGAENAVQLGEGELAIRLRLLPGNDPAYLGGVLFDIDLGAWKSASGERHEPRFDARRVEARLESEAHVAGAVEVSVNVTFFETGVVVGESVRRGVAGLQGG